MFFEFWFTMNTNPYQKDIVVSLPIQTCTACIGYVAFSSYFFISFYPWPYILNIRMPSSKIINIFTIAVYITRNVFWKICPLFGQLLITCLKCSRASFSPSSCNKKIRWRQGLELVCFLRSLSVFLEAFKFKIYCGQRVRSEK